MQYPANSPTTDTQIATTCAIRNPVGQLVIRDSNSYRSDLVAMFSRKNSFAISTRAFLSLVVRVNVSTIFG